MNNQTNQRRGEYLLDNSETGVRISAACVKKRANFRSMCEKACEFPQHV
jgi:hypothetical protein